MTTQQKRFRQLQVQENKKNTTTKYIYDTHALTHIDIHKKHMKNRIKMDGKNIHTVKRRFMDP